jgi:putative membrane protein
MTRYKWFLLIVFALFWCWAAYNPVFPDDWLLENYLVFMWVPIILLLGRYFKLSELSYTLITIFMCLHVIGSHYTYAGVPFGDTLKDWFNSDRNMYDRLVHFSFGLLLAYPIREVFMRLAKVKGFWSYYFPLDLVLAFSCTYELIEWWSARNVDPAAGLAFLGSQGDVWDAQKDMGLAGLGSLIAMLLVLCVHIALDKKWWKEMKESFRIEKGDKPLGEVKLKEMLKKKK